MLSDSCVHVHSDPKMYSCPGGGGGEGYGAKR